MTRQELFNLADSYKSQKTSVKFIEICIEKDELLTEALLEQIHKYLGGNGLYRIHSVKSSRGDGFLPGGAELKRLMGHFMSQLQISKQMFHPIEYAAICHKRLLELSPFEDRNEEVAFMVMNLLLVQAGYKAIAISKAQETEYKSKLSAAQHPSQPEIDEFIAFIAECEVEAQKKSIQLGEKGSTV